MNQTFPMAVALCAALLGFLGTALTVNVIINRVRTGIHTGDGGVARLAQAIRAQGNFVEQAPLVLIIIAVAAAVGVRPLVIDILAAVLLVARLLSAYALNRSLGPSQLRQFSAGVSVLLLAAASLAILLALAGVR